jgi:hypothetical protein
MRREGGAAFPLRQPLFNIDGTGISNKLCGRLLGAYSCSSHTPWLSNRLIGLQVKELQTHE